jgi:hypothetical protein
VKFNILDILGGMSAKDILGSVLHHASPKLAKPVFEQAFNKMSDAGAQKVGRLLSMAGEKLQALDRAGAAGDAARIVGEIKL